KKNYQRFQKSVDACFVYIPPWTIEEINEFIDNVDFNVSEYLPVILAERKNKPSTEEGEPSAILEKYSNAKKEIQNDTKLTTEQKERKLLELDTEMIQKMDKKLIKSLSKNEQKHFLKYVAKLKFDVVGGVLRYICSSSMNSEYLKELLERIISSVNLKLICGISDIDIASNIPTILYLIHKDENGATQCLKSIRNSGSLFKLITLLILINWFSFNGLICCRGLWKKCDERLVY
ncbi:hypothetical protein ROZALSC1DRAFT_25860, partial [Rozella allomycis CSF55]